MERIMSDEKSERIDIIKTVYYNCKEYMEKHSLRCDELDHDPDKVDELFKLYIESIENDD